MFEFIWPKLHRTVTRIQESVHQLNCDIMAVSFVRPKNSIKPFKCKKPETVDWSIV